MHLANRNSIRGASALALLMLTAGVAAGATTGTGTVSADIGQLVEIAVSDGTIAAYSEYTPTSGADTVKFSTSDYLRFSNAKSNVQQLVHYGVTVSFASDADGSTSTSTVSYQGATTPLADLVYLAQGASADFLPWKIVTASDLTSEGATGWTTHAGCGTMTYQGSFSVVSYSSSGVEQSPLTRYYRVCDSGTEIYVASSKDVSGGDMAYVYTQTASGASATAANYEVSIGGAKYVFYSAGSASDVTLRQGPLVALGASAQTTDVYALLELPDGFPAGVLTATVTATANDIVG